MIILRLSAALAAVVLLGIGVWVGGNLAPDGGSEETRTAAPSARDPEGSSVPPRVIAVAEPAKPPELGDGRYLAHVGTDKPLYRPGERVYARAVILEAFTHEALETPVLTAFEVRSAQGAVVAQQRAMSSDSVAAFGWVIPPGQAGGTFTLAAKFPPAGYPDAEATFDVRGYRVPRLRTDLQFLRKAYGPGDEVTATLSSTRAEGGVPRGATVTAVATVDGEEVTRETTALDDSGSCRVTFRLPAEIAAGDGTLAMTVEDGGVRETAAKSLPIVLNRLELTFYPEGGEIVAGVPARLYFEARTPKADPADVSGRILDSGGQSVARFETLHEGRGQCTFTPRAGERYRAVVERPRGVSDTFELPAVAANGFSLAALESTVPAGDPVKVRVASPSEAGATVGLFLRERELARQVVGLEAGRPIEVSLVPADRAEGVLRVTVFDAAGAPRAERLVFRQPQSRLRIELEVEPERTTPASEIEVRVRTTAGGQTVPAVVGLSVVDDAVLDTVDPRDRAPRLPTAALLGAEVRELKDAALYLAADEEAPARTDLLLGTQGWRRFAFVDLPAFVKERGLAARRALAWKEPVVPRDGVQGWALAFGDANGVAEFDGDLDGRPDFPAPDLALDEFRKGVVERKPFALPVEGIPVVDDEKLLPGLRPVFEFAGDIALDVTEPVWARVYAHRVEPSRPVEERTDFRETVYWNVGLPTSEDGEAKVTFHVSDSVTSFRIRADGFTSEGVLGAADAVVEVRRPFYLEPKFPLEVTAGDRVELPETHSGGDAAVVRRASELLDQGYQKLVSFECGEKGYEWFGADPGHEALTAYGLMEFADMQKVYPVDPDMLERTTEWLLSRRDGTGAFARNPKALDSFGGAPQDITDAYIVWALTEAGLASGTELRKEIDALKERAMAAQDPYLLALVANGLLNVEETDAAEAILARLAKMQDESGALPGARTSITRSGGESLEIETVSLAILGWLRSPKHVAHVERAIRWLSERSKGGRFGATQSTILALKAIIAYDAVRAKARGDGTITLLVDGEAVGEVAYRAEDQEPIRFADFAARLGPGDHELELRMDGKGAMPYSFEVGYHSSQPASSAECRVGLATSLSRTRAVEGDPVSIAVEVKNRTAAGLPMAVAVVGLPGGLEARADQLKELVRAGKVDAVEVRGREVIFYWRALEPDATRSFDVSCLAAVPGEYTGPASRAYLYYTDEHKVWVPGLAVAVTRE